MDGFFKYRIRPRLGWVAMQQAGATEGFYVREAVADRGSAIQALALAVVGLGNRKDPRH